MELIYSRYDLLPRQKARCLSKDVKEEIDDFLKNAMKEWTLPLEAAEMIRDYIARFQELPPPDHVDKGTKYCGNSFLEIQRFIRMILGPHDVLTWMSLMRFGAPASVIEKVLCTTQEIYNQYGLGGVYFFFDRLIK